MCNDILSAIGEARTANQYKARSEALFQKISHGLEVSNALIDLIAQHLNDHMYACYIDAGLGRPAQKVRDRHAAGP
jgi:hypothetical protein